MVKKMNAVGFLMAMAMVLSLFSGCSGNNSGAGGSSQASAGGQNQAGNEKVAVRILTRYSNPDNVREKYFIDRVAKFKSENPDIDLQDISVSDENSRDTKFKTSVASGNPIEVFNFLGYAANIDYVKNGVVADLDPLFKEDPEWTKNYKKSLFSPVDYSAYGIEGIYGIPTTPYGVCTFYNKAIFDKLGIQIPETWEQIEAAAPKLIEKGITPMAFGAKDNYRGGHFLTALSMKVYGADLKDRLISGEEKWNGKDTVSLISYMKKLYDEGVFGKNNLAYTADGELAKLESGEAAICFSGSWNIATINGFSNAKDIVCKGFPYFEAHQENKDMWMGGPDDFLAISSKPGDADYDATVKVLKYFSSQDYWQGLYEVQKGSGTYPVSFGEVIPADTLTNGFNEYYNSALNMIGEIEQYDKMAALMDVVRTNMQTIFSGSKAQEIGDVIQGEVDNYLASNK